MTGVFTSASRYQFVKELADGLVVISREGRDAMWTRRKLRKPARCYATGVDMEKGDEAWGPIGNMDYRMERITVAFVDKLRASGPLTHRANGPIV